MDTVETNRQPISDRMREYYEFILQFAIDHHRLPTHYEIRDGMGVTSHSSARWAIDMLLDRGWLVKKASGRGYQLPDFGEWRGTISLAPGQSLTVGNTYIGITQVNPATGICQVRIITDAIHGQPERNLIP